LPLFKNVGINVIEKPKLLFWWVNYSRYIDSSMVLASWTGEKFNNAEKLSLKKQ
jgi:hypothetical protein